MGADNKPLLLIQFTRAPVAGQVKTRMMPHLSAVEACKLHSELTLWTCRQLLASGLGDVELSVLGDTRHPLFTRCRELGVTRVSEQRGADLGQRMFRAMDEGLEKYAAVILVGSDCPGIDADYLRLAVEALRAAEVVLGPATDGGYVLIGARRSSEVVFQDIPWGSEQVYEKTLTALDKAGLSWDALPVLADIDRLEDLPLWEVMQRGAVIQSGPA